MTPNPSPPIVPSTTPAMMEPPSAVYATEKIASSFVAMPPAAWVHFTSPVHRTAIDPSQSSSSGVAQVSGVGIVVCVHDSNDRPSCAQTPIPTLQAPGKPVSHTVANPGVVHLHTLSLMS